MLTEEELRSMYLSSCSVVFGNLKYSDKEIESTPQYLSAVDYKNYEAVVKVIRMITSIWPANGD